MQQLIEKDPVRLPLELPSSDAAPTSSGRRAEWLYAVPVVIGLLLMELVGEVAYASVITAVAFLFFVGLYALMPADRHTLLHRNPDRRDGMVILATYLAVVFFFRIAFQVIHNNDGLLFVIFATGLLIGVGVPVIYTVWFRARSLASLGLSVERMPATLALAILFAGVQFSITLWGYELPKVATDWVPLLGMAMMVGLFEAIFFRGFVQGRLEESFGAAPAVFGAAFLYSVYHVGYGMGARETIFLFGLGVVYALAYLSVRNVLVLWPLLLPLGSFFAQVDGGELLGRLPMAALLGFADVIALFVLVIWLARRKERRASTWSASGISGTDKTRDPLVGSPHG